MLAIVGVLVRNGSKKCLTLQGYNVRIALKDKLFVSSCKGHCGLKYGVCSALIFWKKLCEVKYFLQPWQWNLRKPPCRPEKTSCNNSLYIVPYFHVLPLTSPDVEMSTFLFFDLFDVLSGRRPFWYSAGTTFWLFCGGDVLVQNIVPLDHLQRQSASWILCLK